MTTFDLTGFAYSTPLNRTCLQESAIVIEDDDAEPAAPPPGQIEVLMAKLENLRKLREA